MVSGYLVYNNRMWILSGGTDCTQDGGVHPDVWSSSDGANWTCANSSAPFGVRWESGSVVFQNKMWLIGGLSTGGFKNDVWNSTDGINWTQVTASAPFSGREGFGCVVFNNRIWVICGDNSEGLAGLSDVWSSPDGVNWTQAGNFPSARTGLSCVAFNGAIWVISGGWAEPDPSAGAGMYMVDSFNDSWYSTDGANWTEAASNAPFSGRVYASAQVYNSQIWLIGGVNTSYFSTVSVAGVFGDAWVSNDGANWTQACPSLPFSPRFSAESYVFNNELWIVGGSSAIPAGAVYDSDAWHHP
jgi:leucine-zipper-like transcriptional regulator 1